MKITFFETDAEHNAHHYSALKKQQARRELFIRCVRYTVAGAVFALFAVMFVFAKTS
jgi:hypothetical protein